MKHHATLIIPYFGKWPEWFNYTLLSMSRNPSTRWIFYTDCGIPEFTPPNVEFREIEFSNYCELASAKIGEKLVIPNAYKLCDLKPALGKIHKEDLGDSHYYGYCDIDLVFGDLDGFIRRMMPHFNVVSTHSHLLSGHLTLMRNTSAYHHLYKSIPNYISRLQSEQYEGCDEHDMARLLLLSRRINYKMRVLLKPFSWRYRRLHFKECYTTPLFPGKWMGLERHPSSFKWKNGKITAIETGDYSYPYLHFMNWRSAKYLRKTYGVPEWIKQKPQFGTPTIETEVFEISTNGIF